MLRSTTNSVRRGRGPNSAAQLPVNGEFGQLKTRYRTKRLSLARIHAQKRTLRRTMLAREAKASGTKDHCGFDDVGSSGSFEWRGQRVQCGASERKARGR
eukprot:GFKZ01012232.1.p2 GENE.GFKZ01012232.1~~GFKZ01012232.1.p2  ORF type:complete len:100 (+),score=0.91 GFKZ01012232.1:341-640(+)